MEAVNAIFVRVIGFFAALLSSLGLLILVLGIIGFFIWQNRRRLRWAQKVRPELLGLHFTGTPEDAEQTAETLFSNLHTLLRPKRELVKEGLLQEHLSFEIRAHDSQIHYYLWTPRHLKEFVINRLKELYSIEIEESPPDYSKRQWPQVYIDRCELELKPAEIALKTEKDDIDRLRVLSNALEAVRGKDEEVWIQLLLRPTDQSWQRKVQRKGAAVETGWIGNASSVVEHVAALSRHFLTAFFKPPGEQPIAPQNGPLNDRQKALLAGTKEKLKAQGFQAVLRLVAIAPQEETAQTHLETIIKTYKQFERTGQHTFLVKKRSEGEKGLTEYRARYFGTTTQILNSHELGALYRLPLAGDGVQGTEEIKAQSLAQLFQQEAEIPASISPFGYIEQTDGQKTQCGLKREDRNRHVYVIGQTGAGKSGLLQLLTLSDIYHKYGFAIIDPHGDYAREALRYIPRERLEDVIYFDPGDTEYPFAFNPLELPDPALKSQVCSELIGVFKRMFGTSWGPRLEYILRYTILALLEYPEATMLDITRMLTDKNFRQAVIWRSTDPLVRNFWLYEFGSWNDRFASEAISPVLNKVGAFTANPMVRNIIGQPHSSFNIRQVMDEGKILIVNLSRGLIGEDNADILGSLIVTKIQLAAISRANTTAAARLPFYLYVDEFQNFATDSFAAILSEARKYGLCLTIANQYVGQMSEAVRSAVFGNVGTFIIFRVGADDAHILERYVGSEFKAEDLINLDVRQFVASMTVEGTKTPAFSAKTLELPAPHQDASEEIVATSRQRYGSPQHAVEQRISLTTGTTRHTQPTRPAARHNQARKNGQIPRDPQAPIASSTPNVSETGELQHEDIIHLHKI